MRKDAKLKKDLITIVLLSAHSAYLAGNFFKNLILRQPGLFIKITFRVFDSDLRIGAGDLNFVIAFFHMS